MLNAQHCPFLINKSFKILLNKTEKPVKKSGCKNGGSIQFVTMENPENWELAVYQPKPREFCCQVLFSVTHKNLNKMWNHVKVYYVVDQLYKQFTAEERESLFICFIS